MEERQELGALIREARLARGMSLGQLASAIGRSSSSVRRWERGDVAPAAPVLVVLAEVLGIDSSVIEEAKSSMAEPEASGSGPSGVHVSTVEQPVVEIAEAEPQPPIEEGEQTRPRAGLFADVWKTLTVGRESWIGWARGILTVGALIAMLFILIWAITELLDAVSAIIDSFDVGSSPGEGS